MTGYELTGFELEGEYFKDIPSYDGKYEISTFGRVLSFCKKTPKILSNDCSGRYQRVGLTGGKHENIHRLVALTFIDNPNDHPDVDHIDGNRDNNNVENLRWVSKVENQANRITKGRKPEIRHRWKEGKKDKSKNFKTYEEAQEHLELLGKGSIQIRACWKYENGDRDSQVFDTVEEAQDFLDNIKPQKVYGENITNDNINLEKNTSTISMKKNPKRIRTIDCECGGRTSTEDSKKEAHENTQRHKNWVENGIKFGTGDGREICGCGGNYLKSHRARHQKRLKHIEWLATQQ